MAFSYSAGSSTPTFAGLIEWPSLRFNDGTFQPLLIPPITDSAPLRVGSAPVPDGGGTVADPKLDVWTFDVVGWVVTDDIADMQAAIDYVKSKVNVWKGWQTVTFNAQGWADARTMTLQLGGQITVAVPDKGVMRAPERVITIPCIAADPRMYGVTEVATTVTTGTSITNDGNHPAPYVVRFNGPQTDPQLDRAGTSGGDRIKYVGTITSGHWVEVNTLTGEALDDNGDGVYEGISAFTSRYLKPGAWSWDASNASGAGSTVVTFNPAWA